MQAAAQRKARWPGAAAKAITIANKLNRLLPVQCSEKLSGVFIDLKLLRSQDSVELERCRNGQEG